MYDYCEYAMTDNQEDKSKTQRRATNSPQIKDLKQRQDKVAQEQATEQDVTGGAMSGKL